MLLCFDDDDVDDDSDDDMMMKIVMMTMTMMMMIWMMGGPLHCLIKPTQVAVVLRRLHVALAKAGSRLRRYKM